MTDSMRAAREDLAFLKAIAEDKGPLPTLIGAHMLAIGLPYGLNFILIWAIFAGLLPFWPREWISATWIPGTIVYVPLSIFLHVRGSQYTAGPTARLFTAAWGAVGLTAIPIVAVMLIAQARTGLSFAILWPALSFVLYGGAWASLAIIRRKAWHGVVALGSYATALTSAWLIDHPGAWLVMAAGILLFLAAPGAAILWRLRWVE
jgi:hypothetical protein